MSRIKLDEQPDYKFQYNTTVNTRDLNYANHLGNDSLVGILQDARVAIFQQLGVGELDLGDGQTGIIIGDLVVNFKAEGFLFDKLQVESQIGEITDKSFRIFYKITKVKDNIVLALAETGLVAFDYKAREITRLPVGFKEMLEKFGKM